MRVCLRPLAPGELNHEKLWLVVSIGALALATFWLSAGLPWPRCVFHDLTGYPCLTCGTTRAARALLNGNLSGAVALNPLMSVAFALVILFDFYATVALALRTLRIRFYFTRDGSQWWLRMAIVIILASNWIYLIERRLV